MGIKEHINDGFEADIDDLQIEKIALIGASCRFPDADNIEQFWENLVNGKDSVRSLDENELGESGVAEKEYQQKNYVNSHIPLKHIDRFDADFFDYTNKEAELMDPQQRLFLLTAWEALERSGYDPSRYAGRIGVYAGVGLNFYFLRNLLSNPEVIASAGILPIAISSRGDFMTTQVSHKFNLRGPSVNVNTACSSSLVAIQMACESLLSYQSDLMLAGGSTIMSPQNQGYLYHEGGVISSDGRCRAFDHNADGTSFGSGVGVVALKRLSEAVADNDNILAVIIGSSVNNDGADKTAYSAPGINGQKDVILDAQSVAGVNAETIELVEAHGTGTPLGDAVEVRTLTDAFRHHGSARQYAALGSVKTNIGHLDTAAGVAGFIKIALSLQHKQLVPSLNFERSNEKLDLDNSPFYVNTKHRDWPRRNHPRRACISSFGIGGTNAHLILEEAPLPVERDPITSESELESIDAGYKLLTLSARNKQALSESCQNMIEFIDGDNSPDLSDTAYTLQVGRKNFEYRVAVVCSNRDEAIKRLITAKKMAPLGIDVKTQVNSIIFMFAGIGDQYINMAKGLYETEKGFRETLDKCSQYLVPLLGIDFREILYPEGSSDNLFDGALVVDSTEKLKNLLNRSNETKDPAESRLYKTKFLHPIIFSIEYALARQYMDWGINPDAMIGHSLGEYVAACVANVFSLEDALKLVAKRALLIEAVEPGAMLAVMDSSDKLKPYLDDQVSLAAINGDLNCVLSGDPVKLGQLEKALVGDGIAAKLLNTNHAFHSTMMEEIAAPLKTLFEGISLKEPTIRYASNLTGNWILAEEATNPDYWVKHTCKTVCFNQGVNTISELGENVWLEIGPSRNLATIINSNQGLHNKSALVVSSIRNKVEKEHDHSILMSTLGKMWCCGVDVDWTCVQQHKLNRRIELPTYPFQLKSFWIHPNRDSPLLNNLGAHSDIDGTDNKDKARGPLPNELQTSSQSIAKKLVSSEEVLRLIDNNENTHWSEIQLAVSKLWIELLGVNAIGLDQSFFEVGGSSLSAIQLVTRIHEQFDIGIPVSVVFEFPTVERLAFAIEEVILYDAEQMETPQKVQFDPAVARTFEVELPNGLVVSQFNKVETSHFFKDIFERKTYYKNGIVLNSESVVFDVGANIGLFSIFISKMFPQARIFSFEPAEPIFQCLENNTTRHCNNVKLFNRGLSNEKVEKEFVFYPNTTGMSSFYADEKEEKETLLAIMKNEDRASQGNLGSVLEHADEIMDGRFTPINLKCQLDTLANIVEQENIQKIDLLKIDVQRCEKEVLDGVAESIWPLINQIVIEVHDIENRVSEITSLLSTKGFQIVVEQDELYVGSNIYNLYAIRNQSVI